MKLHLARPTEAQVATFLAAQSADSYSYPSIGATNRGERVAGFDNDHNRVLLGRGEAVFRAAVAALRSWQMFPRDWVYIAPDGAPIVTGQIVAMIARSFGLFWMSAAQLVYVIDEPRRAGFAYGTLAAHIECGEERFLIEWGPDDGVWYDLTAFSRPRRLIIKLGYPVARLLQRRFVRDSQVTLKRMIGKATD